SVSGRAHLGAAPQRLHTTRGATWRGLARHCPCQHHSRLSKRSCLSGSPEKSKSMRDLQSPSHQTLRVARWLLLSLGVGFWLCHLPGFIQDDIRLYYSAIERFHEGSLPYRDRVFPYPPYALAWLLLPALCGNVDGFWIAFM